MTQSIGTSASNGVSNGCNSTLNIKSGDHVHVQNDTLLPYTR